MASLQVYLVGGAVRDQLLGLDIKDRDWVVVGAKPEQMLAQGYQQVGQDFPVFLHPQSKEEYALARTERKTGAGYTGFDTYHGDDVSLEEDLLRRDLSINAMAQTAEGELIDPYNGQQDLRNKVLRHVSPAFSEDPLRVLRLARFYARFKPLGFSVADDTKALCAQLRDAGELTQLSAERVWQETQRAMAEADASAYFELLHEMGCLQPLMPELAALFGVPQPEQYHPEIDTGVHALLCMEQAKKLSDAPEAWYAALVHDLGKGLTPPEKWPKHYGHEQSGLKPVKRLNKTLKVPRNFADLSLLVCEFHTHVHRAEELKASTVLKVIKRCDALRRPERFELFLLCCQADAQGRTGFEQTPYPQAELFRTWFKAVEAVEVKALVAQGLKGAELGQAIEQAQVAAIKNQQQV